MLFDSSTRARAHLTHRSFQQEIRRDSAAPVCMFKGILCSDHVGVGGNSYHASSDHPEKTLEGTPVEHIFTFVLLFLHNRVLKVFAVALQEADGLGNTFWGGNLNESCDHVFRVAKLPSLKAWRLGFIHYKGAVIDLELIEEIVEEGMSENMTIGFNVGAWHLSSLAGGDIGKECLILLVDIFESLRLEVFNVVIEWQRRPHHCLVCANFITLSSCGHQT